MAPGASVRKEHRVRTPKRLPSPGCCALHQEIPEHKLSRVSAYDWFGSVALIPLATALAGPAQSAFGRAPALWGTSALIVAATALVLLIPDIRRLRRRDTTKAVSADAEGAGRGLRGRDGVDVGEGTGRADELA
ncbi:hypothetical protein GCM10017776_20350 [Streptomyces griseoluteus]|nr:hypothetical protein GCM10017776_20350 [Streptomyces griseoluteus]